MTEKRHGGGGGAGAGAGGFTALRLLGVAVLAFLLPRPAGAADDAKWHAHARPAAGSNGAVAVGHGAPAPHVHAAGLPPLSAPAPTAGADDLPPPPAPVPVSVSVSSPPSREPGPHFGFPLQPGPGTASAAAPGLGPVGEGYPFIGSNPTVPLPTGMTNTATVLPLPNTGDAAAATKVVGLAASLGARVSMIGLGILLATLSLSLSKI